MFSCFRLRSYLAPREFTSFSYCYLCCLHYCSLCNVTSPSMCQWGLLFVFWLPPLSLFRFVELGRAGSGFVPSVAMLLALSCCSNARLALVVYVLNIIVIISWVSCFAVSCARISFLDSVGSLCFVVVGQWLFHRFRLRSPSVSVSLFESSRSLFIGLRCLWSSRCNGCLYIRHYVVWLRLSSGGVRFPGLRMGNVNLCLATAL